jgi:mitochondrial ornithine carrier protein
MAENATIFLGYRTFQQIIRQVSGNTGELSLPQLAIAGGGAGVLTSFVL